MRTTTNSDSKSSSVRFESIVKLWRHRRDELQLDLAQLTAQHENVASQLAVLRSKHEELLRGGTTARVGVVTIEQIRAIERQDTQFRAAEKSLVSKSDSFSQQIDDQRVQLLEAQQDVQKLEKLQSASLAEHQMHSNRAAQHRSDEQASMAYQRSRS